MEENGLHTECLQKQEKVKELFAGCTSPEERYHMLISLGRDLTPLDPIYRQPTNEVPGCQSVMYLRSWMERGRIYFQVESEALISAGLAAVLILVYSGLTPEEILKCPPTYLEELQLSSSLTPNRASGLYSIHLKMKQEALRLFFEQEKTA